MSDGKRMQWGELINPDERISAEREWNPEDDSLTKYMCLPPFEQDYQRLVTSAVVRSLQNKAQLFSLDQSTFIRTRLTHSMEVAEIAKALARSLPEFAKYRAGQKYQEFSKDIASLDAPGAHPSIDEMAAVLQTAGLLHDLGNPPFGHKGENAISKWMVSWCRDHESLFSNRMLWKDLQCYEGNAQSLRLLASDPKIADLEEIATSHAVLGAISKYTIPAWEWVKDQHKDNDTVWVHKPGYYWSERSVVKKLHRIPDDRFPGSTFARSPLAYLLEAADDIAYVTSDFEDALTKGLITPSYLNSWAETIQPNNWITRDLVQLANDLQAESSLENIATVHRMVFQVRTKLMYVAVYEFAKHYEEIMTGSYEGELLSEKDSFAKEYIGIVKGKGGFLPQFVYNDPVVTSAEAEGAKILQALLNELTRFICRDNPESDDALEKNEDFQGLPSGLKARVRQLRELVPEDEKDAHDHSGLYTYHEMRAVLDYISLLTDARAQELYQAYEQLSGPRRTIASF